MIKFNCLPATVYIILALIVAFVYLIYNFIWNPANFDVTYLFLWIFSQSVSILICYLIISALCTYNITFAWILTIIAILCSISTITSVLLNTNNIINLSY